MRLLALLLLVLLSIACSPIRTSDSIYRGTESGFTVQVVVSTFYNSEGLKSGRTIQKFAYNRNTRQWVPLGPVTSASELDTSAETENLDFFPFGNAGDPPAANITTPHNIYLANNFGQSAIVVLNAATLAESTRIPVPSFIRILAAAPDGLSVAFNQPIATASQIRFIDVLTNNITRSLTLPNNSDVKGINYAPDGSRIYVADSRLGIHAINPNPLAISQTIALPAGISSIVSSSISPDGRILLARTSGSAALSIFDLTALAWTSPVTIGRNVPLGEQPCVFHPYGNEFYCSTTDGIGIFDTATMTGIASITLPRGEILNRFHSFEGGAYLLVCTDKALRMVNLTTREIEATLTPESPTITFSNSYPLSQF